MTLTVERSQRSIQDTPWYWIDGDTYPHRDTLKLHGCRWSKRRQAWYFIGAELPSALQQLIDEHTESDVILSEDDHEPCSVEEASQILGVPILDMKKPATEAPKPTPEPEPDSEEPAIRIIKPEIDAELSEAIRQIELQTAPLNTSRTQKLIYIPQSYCGELTGSITGNVWCYGFAVHEGVCIYLNIGGPRMAVEAIRAKLGKGDIVTLIPDDSPSIELTAGEGNTGMYSAFVQNLSEAKFTSMMLCHERLMQPNYGGKSTTFIMQVSEEPAMLQLREHVTKLVKVPVFPEWTHYIWQAGQSAMLVRSTRSGGGIKMWTISLDSDAWSRLITGGLSEGIIKLTVSQAEPTV